MNVQELMTKILKGPWRVWDGALWIMMDDVPKGPAHIADARELVQKEKIGLGEPRGWGWLTGHGHGALALTQQEGYDIQRAIAYQIAAAPTMKAALQDVQKFLRMYTRDIQKVFVDEDDALSPTLDTLAATIEKALSACNAPPKEPKT